MSNFDFWGWGYTRRRHTKSFHAPGVAYDFPLFDDKEVNESDSTGDQEPDGGSDARDAEQRP